MHADPAAFDAPAPADAFAELHHTTQSDLAFFWMGRLIRLRRRWYRSVDEKIASEALQQECLDALRSIEQHLGTEYLTWVFRTIKSKQQVRNDKREPRVTIPKR